MEIKISARQMLKILYVLSWIIFIGVCIEAGSFVFNAFFTLVINPVNASYFNLSGLYAYDPGHFAVMLLLMWIVTVLKACMFYLIVKILEDKKLDLAQPFNKATGRFISGISYLAVGTGLFSCWGIKYAAWLVKQGVQMPDAQQLRLGGADVWLFMGITLLVIAQIFKRGIELQTENELTI
ncbi:DUF2975 domain-containing protein [Chitinophaga japonensis]|uniref:DUF2975 family protein n=1 Tax=Chitinophaga japonensis TaxID=104662 RepID=A0A562SMQ4_CHIJA|nr:DUF2975 domain-containing protein [Chitinophaga japonensis]TWI81976.1 Protein of unknown function (DUF2975) [Chitinophaga japonensis]